MQTQPSNSLPAKNSAINNAYPVYDFIGQRTLVSPHATALEDYASGEQLSYTQLNARSNQSANLLDSLAIGEEDTVAILALNCIAFFELLFACGKNGAILVPLNWRQTAAETQPIIDDSHITTIFYDSFNKALAESLLALNPGITIIPLENEDNSEDKNYGAIRDACSTEYKAKHRTVDHVWYLLYTSGTTGKPKAVIQSFGMALANYINTVQAIDLTSLDTTVNFLPLFHTGGINLYTLPALISGARVTVLPKFEPDAIVDLIHQNKITAFFGVPAIYRAIYEHAQFEDLNFSGLRTLGCGGAPIQEYILKAFADRGVTICNGFGMTETGPMTFLMDPVNAANKIGSIGTPKLLTQVRIINDKGEALPPGEAGELLLAGGNVTPGYWGNPEATEKAFDSDGWLHTGDVAKCDEDGYFYIVDRIKDMFISGGENVYPAEVESAMEQHPDIVEAAIVGIPNKKWGEIGVAFLRVQNDYVLNDTKLTEFARQRLAGYKTPQKFIILEDFPRTAAGKVKKNELRDIANRQS
ncbi:MAG: AMP-binding protein [Agarilytica sp.]